ncbi:MAG: hypothetical protein IJC95_05780 [Clostridia bacterium]|nr:hypothetical protein [Oscillospiraceae bacterium]MBQ2773376.1 hypothetical protein [Clostridia bacterium]MBQ3056977.1 hypothetical protein [Clostridia bacterium]
MFGVDLLVDIATSAVAVLITVLAIYLAMRLLGKLAKFFIVIIVVVFVIWLLLSDSSFLNEIISTVRSAGLGL